MEMPKIGMMTWYTYRNYGSVLQATALYHVVGGMGYAPALIDYRPRGNTTVQGATGLARKAYVKVRNRNPRYKQFTAQQDELFEAFLSENITTTEPCRSLPELRDLNAEFDAFVCGSDQIWSPLCYDEKYFLTFAEEPEKMVAYAPSMPALASADPEVRRNMGTHISRFRHLSVREAQSAGDIRALTGQEAEVVLDPTLLLKPEAWDVLLKADNLPRIPGEYILCYFLGNAGKYTGFVSGLAKKLGMPYYCIPVSAAQAGRAHTVPFNVGPAEFVSLIKHAKLICTDSFHGTAFAVNYNIPFYVFKRFSDTSARNQNGRITHFLSMLGMEDRLADPREIKNDNVCDFTKANLCLEAQRRKSLEFLEASLAAATGAKSVRVPTCVDQTDPMCCGCGACAAVCQVGAIRVVRDSDGFLRCAVERDKCVDCGKCAGVCPMSDITALRLREAKALLSAKSTAMEHLRRSSSGGIGQALAEFGQRTGRYVCGCAYDASENMARHIVIAPDELDKLALLQGSKYIQSVSADGIAEIAALSGAHKTVFFGTPCQAAAVDKVLRKSGLRDNALLVDLICHGVPSYHLWDSYLAEVDRKTGVGSHPRVAFRWGACGWRPRRIRIDGNNRIYEEQERRDDFYAFFRRGFCNMESCSECPYRERSAADIRIGDYWGPRFRQDQEGVSMVIVNTERGAQVIRELQEQHRIAAQRQALEEYWSVQYPSNRPKPAFREDLIAQLRSGETSLHSLRKKYCFYEDIADGLSSAMEKMTGVLGRGR